MMCQYAASAQESLVQATLSPVLLFLSTRKLCFLLSVLLFWTFNMFLTKPLHFSETSGVGRIDRSDDPSLVWSVVLSNGLFIPLVAIFITLRLFTKFSIAKQVFLDDCQ